jgi:DNA polymerase III epsilon subunit-like protein
MCDYHLEVVDYFDLKVNPVQWSEEAEKVHRISRDIASNYKRFNEVYQDLISWMQAYGVKEFWQHTKPDNYGKTVHYDYAILRLSLFNVDQEAYFYMYRIKPYSTLTLAKSLQDRFNFSGFSLDKVCNTLGIELDHHSCKSDAEACLEIMKKLLPLTTRENLGVKYETVTDDLCEQKPQKRNSRVSKRKSQLSI